MKDETTASVAQSLTGAVGRAMRISADDPSALPPPDHLPPMRSGLLDCIHRPLIRVLARELFELMNLVSELFPHDIGIRIIPSE